MVPTLYGTVQYCSTTGYPVYMVHTVPTHIQLYTVVPLGIHGYRALYTRVYTGRCPYVPVYWWVLYHTVYRVQYSSTVLQWYTTVVLLGCIPYTVLQHGTYTTVLHLPIGTCTHTHPG